MYIGFNLDEVFYSGTATLVETENKLEHYLIDLNESVHDNIQFALTKSPEGKWIGEPGTDPDIVRAVTAEIEGHDEGYTGEPLAPNNYYSTERSNTEKPVFKDGEITNEPDDVNEQSVNP